MIYSIPYSCRHIIIPETIWPIYWLPRTSIVDAGKHLVYSDLRSNLRLGLNNRASTP